MSSSRTHITFPAELLTDLDRMVEKGNRSRFVAEAVRNALLIARQKEALRQTAGSWKDKDHLELKRGAAWVRKLRRESETRFKNQFRNK